MAPYVVDTNEFIPMNHVYAIPTSPSDPSPCCCGIWCFYSIICGGLYHVFPCKCGRSRTAGGIDMASCAGKGTRFLVASVWINARCLSAHPHTHLQIPS